MNDDEDERIGQKSRLRSELWVVDNSTDAISPSSVLPKM